MTGERPGGGAPPVAAGRAGDLVADLLPGLRAFAIPMRTRFRGITVREGALMEGPAGWGEFSPFPEYGPRECARWLAGALEAATSGWPAPVRAEVPVRHRRKVNRAQQGRTGRPDVIEWKRRLDLARSPRRP